MPIVYETITIQSVTETVTDAGGVSESWATYATCRATQQFYRRRFEQAEQGGQMRTNDRKCFFVNAPYPANVTVKMRIRDAAGAYWRIQDVRPYDKNLQIDAERIV